MEVIRCLKASRGEFTVKGAIVLLIVAILTSAGMSIWHIYAVCEDVREKTNESVLAVAAVNVPEFYGGARETDGFARHGEGEGAFGSDIYSEDVLETLTYAVGGSLTAANRVEVAGSFDVYDLHTEYVNAEGSILHFRTTLTVQIPLKLYGVTCTVTKRMEVRSSYDPKF